MQNLPQSQERQLPLIANQQNQKSASKPSMAQKLERGREIFQEIKQSPTQYFSKFKNLDSTSMIVKFWYLRYWELFGGPHSLEDQQLMFEGLQQMQEIRMIQLKHDNSILSPLYSLIKWFNKNKPYREQKTMEMNYALEQQEYEQGNVRNGKSTKPVSDYEKRLRQ